MQVTFLLVSDFLCCGHDRPWTLMTLTWTSPSIKPEASKMHGDRLSARLWIKIMVWGGNEVRNCFRINSASHVGA